MFNFFFFFWDKEPEAKRLEMVHGAFTIHM